MESYDLVVVGAGIYGLVSTATYHRLHPTARILLLEASPSVGGPWAPHRTFPGLKTNNLWGTYQIPDFPMDARFGVKPGEHIPAEKLYAYLRAYAEENGVLKLCRFDTRVERIGKGEKGKWELACRGSSQAGNSIVEENVYTIATAKLILATGVNSKPSMPRYPTSPSFAPLVVHSKDFPSHFSTIVRPNSHTLVVGAGKSAWDIAYACATQPDSTATMLIRPSGNGPTWMSPSHVTPLGLWLEKLVFTRFFGFMSPCPWAETRGIEGWLRSFLHGTRIGRAMVGAFWNILGEDVIRLNGLDSHAETAKLRPWRSAFEVGNALSIHNYPTSFFALVRSGRIQILVDEIASLGPTNTAVLATGATLAVDAIVCATGWHVGSPFAFSPPTLASDLALPSRDPLSPTDAALVAEVETELYTRYPFLRRRDARRMHHPDPSLRDTPTTTGPTQHPYRLYRFLVPPSDMETRSIGFAGALMSLGNPFVAYVQALWLTAYLDGSLTLPPSASPESLRYETFLATQYCAVRGAMGYGDRFPDLVFDSLPWLDALMRDLGFEGKRKGRVLGCANWGAECFASYGPEDYAGLVGEWGRRRGGGGDAMGKKEV